MKKTRLRKVINFCWPLLLFVLVGSGYYKNSDAVRSMLRNGVSAQIPVSFNRTHFILGFSAKPAAYSQRSVDQAVESAPHTGSCHDAYFSPDDNLQQKLIDFIDNEAEEISIAIYAFTNKKIADALQRAHDRGVRIELVADPSFLSDRYTKIGLLRDAGITVHMYNPHRLPHGAKKSMANIMHNKFVIFKKNRDNQPLLWTGSFNFTNSAHLSNQENVVVLDDPAIIQRYKDQFKELKNRSMLYEPH